MNNFIYYTPTKVYFGKGEENNVAKYIKEYRPHKVMIVYGGNSAKKSGLLDKVKSLLEKESLAYVELGGIRPNPELPLVYEGIELAKKEGVDFVLAIGGGSVIDTAKDIANGIYNSNDDVWDYHIKKKVPQGSIHKACILTLSAAGSEMSDSSVITNPDTKTKSGYNSDYNRMDFAILNPELTYTVSKYQTACGAVDIAMHSIERFFALGDEVELTDDICLMVIKNAFKWGKEAYLNPTDYNARAQMMWASSLAHNGLTHSGRTFFLTVHQLEHPLSALYPDIAHGAGLAALWCSWARIAYMFNPDRWQKYMEVVWDIDFSSGSQESNINKGIDKQEEYYKSIGMPTGLSELGVKVEDIETLTNMVTKNGSRELPGFWVMGKEEVEQVYGLALLNN